MQEYFQKLLPSIRLLPRVEQGGFGPSLESSIQFHGPHGHSDAGTVSSSDFSIQISAIFNKKEKKNPSTTTTKKRITQLRGGSRKFHFLVSFM